MQTNCIRFKPLKMKIYYIFSKLTWICIRVQVTCTSLLKDYIVLVDYGMEILKNRILDTLNNNHAWYTEVPRHVISKAGITVFLLLHECTGLIKYMTNLAWLLPDFCSM